MNVGIVGTGFVASMYARTMKDHPTLRLIGAYDWNSHNLAAFARVWPCKCYSSLQDLANDNSVDLILNLTSPSSHYEVSRACLKAGKHVYSEKPLSMTLNEARELIHLADQYGLYLASAPCSLLGETAQTIWKAISDNAIGKVRLVYANFDDGMIAPHMSPWQWTNETGVRWPAKDEFEVGCTYIHAGYILTWLAAFFGPAKSVTAFSSCLIPNKGIHVDQMAPDFSVGCIEYGEGIVARVTCGLVAPRDKSLTVVGDRGVLFADNIRNDACPVYIQYTPSKGPAGWMRAVERVRTFVTSRLTFGLCSNGKGGVKYRLPFARNPSKIVVAPDKRVDFNRGPSELVEAVRQGRPSRLDSRLGLHVLEIVEALQYPERFGHVRKIESTFDRIPPLQWNAAVNPQDLTSEACGNGTG